MSKKLFDIEELQPEDDDGDEFEELTEEEITANLPTFPAIKLADLIITNRYIGLYKSLAVEAMQELARRRVAGDTFQYESYIEDNLKTLPKIDITFPEISSILDKIKVFKK